MQISGPYFKKQLKREVSDTSHMHCSVFFYIPGSIEWIQDLCPRKEINSLVSQKAIFSNII